MEPLPKYIFATGDNLGAGLVVQTVSPPFVARVIQFTDYTEMLRQANGDKFTASSQVPGYSILLIYSGIIGKGNVINGHSGALEEVQIALDAMAQYYLTSKILPHKPRYKRFEL